MYGIGTWLQLLYFRIDNGHEVFRDKGCAEVLKERMRAAVERGYPEHEGRLAEGESLGKIPAPIIHTMCALEAEAQVGAAASQASSRIDAKEADAMSRPLRKRIRANMDKNGARSIEECLTDIGPHTVSFERSSAAGSDPATLRETGLALLGDLKVHTGKNALTNGIRRCSRPS